MSIVQCDRLESELIKLREERRVEEMVRRAEEDFIKGRIHTGNLRDLLANVYR